MKLTIDIEINQIDINQFNINASHFAHEKNDTKSTQLNTLAYLLSHANVSTFAQPLAVKVCEDFNLSAASDYPIAALSAQAENFDTENAYWFCAEPVHLALQRDAFTLHEEVPLSISAVHAQEILHTLNHHFKEDGLQFFLGASGAWYLKITHLFEQFTPVKTHFSQMAIGKNIHSWMPEGQAAHKWRAMLNEIQMLLFEHAVNQAREQAGELAINSFWISGGGFMPPKSSEKLEALLLVSNHSFYKGLAQYFHAQYALLPNALSALSQKNCQSMRMFLPMQSSNHLIAEVVHALKSKKISQLILNIGFYEKTLIAELYPIDFYKFWRKTKPLSHFLKSLNFYD